MKSVHRHSVLWDVISVTCELREELGFIHVDFLVARIGRIPLTKPFWAYGQPIALSFLKMMSRRNE